MPYYSMQNYFYSRLFPKLFRHNRCSPIDDCNGKEGNEMEIMPLPAIANLSNGYLPL